MNKIIIFLVIFFFIFISKAVSAKVEEDLLGKYIQMGEIDFDGAVSPEPAFCRKSSSQKEEVVLKNQYDFTLWFFFLNYNGSILEAVIVPAEGKKIIKISGKRSFQMVVVNDEKREIATTEVFREEIDNKNNAGIILICGNVKNNKISSKK